MREGRRGTITQSFSELLLGSDVGGVTALSLSAIGGFQGKSCVAFSANLLVAVEFFSNGSDGWIHDTSSESQDQMQG